MSITRSLHPDRSDAVLLSRHLVQKPWGRTTLPSWLGQFGSPVGEVWYDASEDPLPVLVKWIFTSERLSIQVHPNDREARERGQESGKEECWIVTDAEPGATLGIGTLEPLTDTELRDAARCGVLEELMDWKPVKPGDWYYIPAGTIHAIGAGVSLIEVQQNADITYRLYDYGRPRELHLEDGVAVASSAPYTGKCGFLDQGAGRKHLTDGPNFSISTIFGDELWRSNRDGEFLIVPMSGFVEIGGQIVEQGDVMFCRGQAACRGERQGSFLAVEITSS